MTWDDAYFKLRYVTWFKVVHVDFVKLDEALDPFRTLRFHHFSAFNIAMVV